MIDQESRLLRYRTADGEILIPAIELIRYLFLHNRTLANAVMRPGALNLLFRPERPGYRPKLTLHFTSRMPKSCLSHQFAQEFAWIALDPEARRAWDSVCLNSLGKQYVTFEPPALKQSVWAFRGIQYHSQWLVLEPLHATGKQNPCEELHYGHPSLRESAHGGGNNGGNRGPNAGGDGSDRLQEQVTYNYELDDGQDGATAGSQKMMSTYSKTSGFERSITVVKLVPKVGKSGGVQAKALSSTAPRTKKGKTVKVSSGEQKLNATLPALEFMMLTPVTWDHIGDLEALAGTVRYMAYRLPRVRFAMSLCQLKVGRAFSVANRKPRVALVVVIQSPDDPPIVLLDIERTGVIALSVIALRFGRHHGFAVMEASVKSALDGLVDGSGHWDREIEKELSSVCSCERLPKMLIPRANADARGQMALWGVKLLRKLGLEAVPTNAEPG